MLYFQRYCCWWPGTTRNEGAKAQGSSPRTFWSQHYTGKVVFISNSISRENSSYNGSTTCFSAYLYQIVRSTNGHLLNNLYTTNNICLLATVYSKKNYRIDSYLQRFHRNTHKTDIHRIYMRHTVYIYIYIYTLWACRVPVDFTHIFPGYFTGAVSIIRLAKCQWKNPKV